MKPASRLSRRAFGKGALAASTSIVAVGTPLRYALGADPLKIGLVLPYSGVYANFGEGIANGLVTNSAGALLRSSRATISSTPRSAAR
jgi:hypothetical protein